MKISDRCVRCIHREFSHICDPNLLLHCSGTGAAVNMSSDLWTFRDRIGMGPCGVRQGTVYTGHHIAGKGCAH